MGKNRQITARTKARTVSGGAGPKGRQSAGTAVRTKATPTRPPKVETRGLRAWWRNANKWTKAIIAIIIAFGSVLGPLQALTGEVSRTWNRITAPSDTEVDANILNSLRTGELLSAFQQSLKTQTTAIIWRGITVKDGDTSNLLDDHLFVLKTVYIEAFVNRNDTVDAYTITARTPDMPQGINILQKQYSFGKTTLSNAPLDGITTVADTCAAHIVAYYEVSGTNEADLRQTIAVGMTSSGAIPNGFTFPACPFANTDSFPVVSGSPGFDRKSGQYQIEERAAAAAYLASTKRLRSKMIVNAITVTGYGYPVMPQMLSLHPEEIALLEPNDPVVNGSEAR